MSNAGSKSPKKMLFDANKAVKKLKSNSVKVKFPCLGRPDKLKVVVFSDATYGRLVDGASQGQIWFLFKGKMEKLHLSVGSRKNSIE